MGGKTHDDPLMQKLQDMMNRGELLSPFQMQQVRTKLRLERQQIDDSVQLSSMHVPKVWTNLVASEEKAKSEILYIIVTGTNSIQKRVHGLHHTLGSLRDVLWFTDENVTHPNFDLIRPIVLKNEYEEEVCKREGLVEETQMKGCKYQRSFYRHQSIWRYLRDHPHIWKDRKWIAKSSDDTFLIPHHVEHVLRAEYDPEVPWVLGMNISRHTYWFFSGGHVNVFSHAAMQIWTQRVDECEGIVIDHAPKKYQKFWWWADDVLLSFCWKHMKLNTAHLPGCFSSSKYGELPRVDRLWTCCNHTPPKEPPQIEELPLSFHTYPYISPEQMFDTWNRIYGT